MNIYHSESLQPPPLRSSRTLNLPGMPAAFTNLRNSITSLFTTTSYAASDAAPAVPAPTHNRKPPTLMLDPNTFARPDFGRYSESNYSAQPQSNYGAYGGNVGVADGGEFIASANFAHGSPLYEPHPNPYATFDQGSPRLEETQRRSALLGHQPSSMRNEYREEDGDGLAALAQQNSRVRTPPAVHEFRRQSRLDLSALRSGSVGSVSITSERRRERERRNGEHRRQFSGADREELILVEEVADMRTSTETPEEKRIRREKRRAARAKANHGLYSNTHKERRAREVKYRGCFSKKNQGVRSKSVMCFVSGGLLLIMASVYLGLALSSSPLNTAGHVTLILLISLFTLLFCHYLLSVARHAFAVHPNTKAKSEANRRAKRAARHRERAHAANHPYDLESQTHDGVWQNQEAQASWDGTGTTQVNQFSGYYAPTYTHSNAERVLGSPDGSPKITPPPPAYGLWRESVRVRNPERVMYCHEPMPMPTMQPIPIINAPSISGANSTAPSIAPPRSNVTTWPGIPIASTAPPMPSQPQPSAPRPARSHRRQMNSHELALAMLEGRVRGEEQPNFARRPPSYESDVSALSEGERQNAREVEATEWAVGRMLGGGGERWVGSDAHPGLGRPRR